MHSISSIFIQAPREKVFELVSQLLRWPEFLPHYRFVRAIPGQTSGENGWVGLHMSANGGWFPVAWKAKFRARPSTLELEFEHTAAFTKGMYVVWKLKQEPEGTLVEIHHDLRFRVGFLSFLLEPILQHGFIEPVASRTLAIFKQRLEAQA